jgi:hypothetical protein
MSDFDPKSSGGFPVLVLIALACALAWVFANPFLGFVIVFVAGAAVLGGVEYVRQRRRPHT